MSDHMANPTVKAREALEAVVRFADRFNGRMDTLGGDESLAALADTATEALSALSLPEPTKAGWKPMETAPKHTPVLVQLSAKSVGARDGQHGTVQVAANRGSGWISIPGMWQCRPVRWHPLPAPEPRT